MDGAPSELFAFGWHELIKEERLSTNCWTCYDEREAGHRLCPRWSAFSAAPNWLPELLNARSPFEIKPHIRLPLKSQKHHSTT
jgi:hypothetical protein